MNNFLLQSAVNYHGQMLSEVLTDQAPRIVSEEDEKHLRMCKFIVKKKKLIFQSIENAAPVPNDALSITTFPIEMFGNLSLQARRRQYFKELKMGDIVITKVMNVTMPQFYKLLILHKPGMPRKLDDLSLVVYLAKSESEKSIETNKFKVNDLLRAVTYSCNVDGRMIIVSLDPSALRDEMETQPIKLGKASESDLPAYVGINYKDQSLVDILHRSPEFSSPKWAEQLSTGYNIDRHRIYSLVEQLDGIDFPKEEYAAALRKKQRRLTSEKHYQKALDHYSEGNITESFLSFNKALQIDPENDDVLVSRAVVYANTKKMGPAIVDLEKALMINKDNVLARKTLSQLLVIAAKSHEEQRNFAAARETLEMAMKFNDENTEAINAFEALKLEEEKILKETSIGELEKEKRKLEESLQREETSPITSASEEGEISEDWDDYLNEEHKRKCDLFLQAIHSTDRRPISSKANPYSDFRERKSRHRHRHHHRQHKKLSPGKKYGPHSSSDHSRSKSPHRSKSPSRRH